MSLCMNSVRFCEKYLIFCEIIFFTWDGSGLKLSVVVMTTPPPTNGLNILESKNKLKINPHNFYIKTQQNKFFVLHFKTASIVTRPIMYYMHMTLDTNQFMRQFVPFFLSLIFNLKVDLKYNKRRNVHLYICT